MKQRSKTKNSSKDCDDSSDEKNCRMVDFDTEKYLKNKPPPPPSGLDKISVIARCTLVHMVSKKSTFLKFHVLDNALRESLFLETLRSIVQNLKFQKSTLLRDTLYVYIY